MVSKPQVDATRAIGSLLIWKYLFRFPLYISLTLHGSWIISIILALYFSSWWFILTIIIIPVLVIAGGISMAGYLISKKLRPRKINRSEARQIQEFVDEFSVKAVAAKTVRKNPAALSAIVAWKYVKGRGKQPVTGILMEPINDIKSLKNKFSQIIKLFN